MLPEQADRLRAKAFRNAARRIGDGVHLEQPIATRIQIRLTALLACGNDGAAGLGSRQGSQAECVQSLRPPPLNLVELLGRWEDATATRTDVVPTEVHCLWARWLDRWLVARSNGIPRVLLTSEKPSWFLKHGF